MLPYIAPALDTCPTTRRLIISLASLVMSNYKTWKNFCIQITSDTKVQGWVVMAEYTSKTKCQQSIVRLFHKKIR